MGFAQIPIWAQFKTRGSQTRHRQAIYSTGQSKRGMHWSHWLADTTTYNKQSRGEGYDRGNDQRDDRSGKEILIRRKNML